MCSKKLAVQIVPSANQMKKHLHHVRWRQQQQQQSVICFDGPVGLTAHPINKVRYFLLVVVVFGKPQWNWIKSWHPESFALTCQSLWASHTMNAIVCMPNEKILWFVRSTIALSLPLPLPFPLLSAKKKSMRSRVSVCVKQKLLLPNANA